MMSNDDFKRRRSSRAPRTLGNKTPRPNSFLIVTEGTKTEPLYFMGLTEHIKQKNGGVLEVVALPHIDISGAGRGTVSLVHKAAEIARTAKIIYQNIWVVFDKDDFTNFDHAISLAKTKGFNVGWSNESFEYFLYLHFAYSEKNEGRKYWMAKLDEMFFKHNLRNKRYQKNYTDIYDILDRDGGVARACKNAQLRMKQFPKKTKPSSINPGTTVHNLVLKLQSYL